MQLLARYGVQGGPHMGVPMVGQQFEPRVRLCRSGWGAYQMKSHTRTFAVLKCVDQIVNRAGNRTVGLSEGHHIRWY